MPEGADERLRALQRVADAALSELPLEEMLGELLTRVTELLSVDTAAILLLDEEERDLVARAAKGLEEEVTSAVRVPVGRGFAGRIARERQPVVIEDVATADIHNPLLRQKGLTSLLGVPLTLAGRLLGVMHVGSLTPRSFDEADANLLTLAGERAAVAIGGRLVERERGLADAFQRSLIPPLPRIPGVALAGRYLPATSRLGGDWYDSFLLPDGKLGVAIGDVVGHGFHAAALMGQLRSGLRAYAVEGRRPRDVLEQLNALLRQLEPGRGATVMYAVFDPLTGDATVAGAGHPPPLVLDAAGRSRFLEVRAAPPLGAARWPGYGEAELQVLPGSLLILFTDGLIERPGESLDEGLRRLQERLARPAASPQALCDRVVDTLLPSGAVADDVAVLAVGAVPFADPLEMKLPADADAMPLLRRVIGRWLREVGATASEVGEIALATSEACANAIEHAYAPGASDFALRLERAGDGQISITVCDRGQWRDARGINRGRGLMLMEGLMDSVDVERRAEGTVVRLGRRLGRAA